jgi:hypothetical protein
MPVATMVRSCTVPGTAGAFGARLLQRKCAGLADPPHPTDHRVAAASAANHARLTPLFQSLHATCRAYRGAHPNRSAQWRRN